jgi:enoyl-CoA hydratase/carnithine racemase
MSNILIQKKDRITIISINREAVMNALDIATFTELMNVLVDFDRDNGAWVAIITGEGDKAFSAGADLSQLGGSLPELPPSIMRGLRIWKPLIAAVNGIAFGGGLELMLACDLVIAAENAIFAVPEVRWGLIPGWGGTQRLTRTLPKVKAAEMLMMGARINAAEALNLGLVNKVVSLPELMPTAEEWARHICDNAPLAVRAVKETMFMGGSKPLEEALALEQEMEQRLSQTEDVKEGIKAFFEKRKPAYEAK